MTRQTRDLNHFLKLFFFGIKIIKLRQYWFICLLLALMKLLGSKILGTNVLEFQYVLCW